MAHFDAQPHPKTWSAFIAALNAHDPQPSGLEAMRKHSRAVALRCRIGLPLAIVALPAFVWGVTQSWAMLDMNNVNMAVALLLGATLIGVLFSAVTISATLFSGAIFLGSEGIERRAKRWHLERRLSAEQLFYVASFCARSPQVANVVRGWVQKVGEISTIEVDLLKGGEQFVPPPALTEEEYRIQGQAAFDKAIGIGDADTIQAGRVAAS